MAFSRAPLRRFNEIQICSPPVGSYDPKVEGTIPIPYPKCEASGSMMRRNSWTGSMQNLLSLNLETLSPRPSGRGQASERIATRLQSTGCLGVVPGGRQRTWHVGRDSGVESERPTGSPGNVAGRARSEACVKISVKEKDWDRDGLTRGKPKGQEVKAHGKYGANVEDSCEAKTTARIEVNRKLSGRTETEVCDKVKCEDGQAASGRVDNKARLEVNANAHSQATGETISFYKGASIQASPASREMECGSEQLEMTPQDSSEEWQAEELPMCVRSRRSRSAKRRFHLMRTMEENGLQWRRHAKESNPELWKRRLECYSGGNLDLLNDITRAEDEVNELRCRVDELKKKNAELDQARVLNERDLLDEIVCRTEELEKADARAEHHRSRKHRFKQDLKNCQVLVENLRLENLKLTEELESSRELVVVLRMSVERSAEELERALLTVENLRLENSKKGEELENSQSLARHLQTSYVTVSETLEESRSLVENLSAEITTKASELENCLVVIQNLQSESSGKSAALEDSQLAAENQRLENLRCRDMLRRFQSLFDGRLTGDSRCPRNSRQSLVEASLHPERHVAMTQAKLRRPATDEDCEMAEDLDFEKNQDDRGCAVGDESQECHSRSGNVSEVELQTSSAEMVQTGYEVVEQRALQSVSSETWNSPSKVQNDLDETQGGQLHCSLNFSVAESGEDEHQQQQNPLTVNSEPILTNDLTLTCNQVQAVNLLKEGSSLKTEKRAIGREEKIEETSVNWESDNPRQCKVGLSHVMELENSRELQEACICRKPDSLEELQRAFTDLESAMPQNSVSGEGVPRETRLKVENRNSGEVLELLIFESDQVKIGERNNQSTSTTSHQNNRTARRERLLQEESSNDLGEGYASCADLISGNAAGDRPTAEDWRETKCVTAISQLKTSEESNSRSRTINRKKKNAESMGTPTEEDVGLCRSDDVYGENLDNFREKFHPKNNEPRCVLREKFFEKFMVPKTERIVGKVGEKSAEKFGEGGGRKTEQQGAMYGKGSAEKLERHIGLDERFGDALECTELIGGDCDTAAQWRSRYEELWSVAQPFRGLLGAFHTQRQLLEGHRNAGKTEIEKLSHDFAKVINHEHERQRIAQIMQLRDQNATLKMELEVLRTMDAASRQVKRR